MNKLKAVVERLVRETGLSRGVSRRIASKTNRLAGQVKWATPLQGTPGQKQGGAGARSKPNAGIKPTSGAGMVLPKIPVSKTVTTSSASISLQSAR